MSLRGGPFKKRRIDRLLSGAVSYRWPNLSRTVMHLAADGGPVFWYYGLRLVLVESS